MSEYSIEIKAKCADPLQAKNILKTINADFVGLNNQKDSYLMPNGHILKLRECNGKTSVFKYADSHETGNKHIYESDFAGNNLMKELLIKTWGLDKIINKQREVYSVGNVKIHIDNVEGLGYFVEVSASSSDDSNVDTLAQQCKYYLKLMRVKDSDIVPFSYSDIMESEKRQVS